MGCHFLLHGIFLTQGLNTCFLYLLCWWADSWPLCQLGSPLSLFFSPSCLSILTKDFLSSLCHQLLLSCDCPSLIHIYLLTYLPRYWFFYWFFQTSCICHTYLPECILWKQWILSFVNNDSKCTFFFFILALSGSHLLKSIWTHPQNKSSCFNCWKQRSQGLTRD